MHDASGWLGVGLYTVSEASHLLRLPTGKVRRWIGGYDYAYRGARRHAAPLWQPQLPKLDDQLGLGFLDLMQLRVVAGFVAKGISLQTVRLALDRAAEFLHHDHPFTTGRFKTDGRLIFIEVAHETGERELYDLMRKQYGFHRIIEPSLVDFEADVMVRWWPMGRRHHVVLDPERAFGAPIVSQGGVPTATLAEVAKSEGSAEAVTRWFPVRAAEVRAAIEFEGQLVGSSTRKLAA